MDLSEPARRRLSMVGIGVLIIGIVAVSAVSMGVFAQEDTTQINESEPNDDRANATMLDPGTDVPSFLPPERGTVDQNDSVDFFAFEVNAGQAINVYHGGNLDNAEFALLNPDGEVIANQSDRQNVITLGDRADQSGTYYLRLTRSEPVRTTTQEYRFAIKLADEDSFESNDNISTATLVEPGSTINGTVVRDEADVFAVNASANDTITANISRREIFAGEPANVRLELLDANGELVGNESTSRDQTSLNYADTSPDHPGRVRATVDDSGTYYLRVTLAGTTDQSRYGGHVGFSDYSLEVDVHNDSDTNAVTTTSAPPTSEEPTTTATTTEDTTTTDAETDTETTTETETDTETTTAQTTTESDDGGKAKQPTDGDDGAASGGNGKSKMGNDGDGDDAADGGNGKSKAD